MKLLVKFLKQGEGVLDTTVMLAGIFFIILFILK